MQDNTGLGRIAIVGLGLMGTSLGMALRNDRLATYVTGYDASPTVGAHAHARGAVDVACNTLAEACAEADLIALAAPVLALRELLPAVARCAPERAILTDLGSTKAEVMAWAQTLLPRPERFVGGHPMAGSERSGPEAAQPDLYRGCIWCLTPTSTTDPAAITAVTGLAANVGARVLRLDAADHDNAVALASHLPLLAAAALMRAAGQSENWSLAATLAAGGFRDTTRVASGDPRMARDICLTNASPLVAALDGYIAALSVLRERVAAHDTNIEEEFRSARETRAEWLAKREGV